MIIGRESTIGHIVIPKNEDMNGFAGTQLQKYLEKVTGAAFSIARQEISATGNIFVGETETAKRVLGSKLTSLNEDAFIIYCDGGNLYLTGKDSVYSTAGTIYAVYAFLEKFAGVTFYAVDEETVPTIGKIEIPKVFIKEEPYFFLRQYLAASTRKDVAYAAKMRIKDCFCGEIPGGALYPLWAGPQGHNYFEFCKPEIYQETHPEWFDMDHGQLCFSSPESAFVTIEGLKKRISDNPQSKFFAFSQNDTPTPCQCEKCKASYEKYSISGTMIRYSNIVAKGIEEWAKKVCPEREIYIVVLAYLFSVAPPVKKEENVYIPIDESVVPTKNIYVFYSTIDYCFYHALTDSACEWNKKFVDEFLGWRALVGDRIMVWNYAANYSHYLNPFYPYNAIQENYRFFAEHGVKYIHEHGSCEAEFVDFSELKTYVYSKLLWNYKQDIAQLMDEFIKAYLMEFPD